jgi:hypothetical protein
MYSHASRFRLGLDVRDVIGRGNPGIRENDAELGAAIPE